jgi:hypothetical protein
MEFTECLQRCMGSTSRPKPPPTVNFAPLRDLASELAGADPEFAAWMRRVGLNPANGTDAVLAAAASIAVNELSAVAVS